MESAEATEFQCNEWLSKEQLSKDFFPDGIQQDTLTYKIKVKTGDIPGKSVGTDARMHITVYGTEGDTSKVTLKKSQFKDKFERGQIDIFEVDRSNIGAVRKVVIGHDGSGFFKSSSWYCEWVMVEVPALGTSYNFPCGRWFSKHEEDGALERELLFEDGGSVVQTEANQAGAFADAPA